MSLIGWNMQRTGHQLALCKTDTKLCKGAQCHRWHCADEFICSVVQRHSLQMSHCLASPQVR